MNKVIALAGFGLIVLICQSVFSMGGEHRKTGPVSFNQGWPAGVKQCIESQDRVYGYWVNQTDIHCYQGKLHQANQFLKEFAKIKGQQVKLVIHPVSQTIEPFGQKNKTVSYDWSITVDNLAWRRAARPKAKVANKVLPQAVAQPNQPKFSVVMDLYLSNDIYLDGLLVPAGVQIEDGGEISKFILKHQKQRAKTNKK